MFQLQREETLIFRVNQQILWSLLKESWILEERIQKLRQQSLVQGRNSALTEKKRGLKTKQQKSRQNHTHQISSMLGCQNVNFMFLREVSQFTHVEPHTGLKHCEHTAQKEWLCLGVRPKQWPQCSFWTLQRVSESLTLFWERAPPCPVVSLKHRECVYGYRHTHAIMQTHKHTCPHTHLHTYWKALS